MEQKQQGEIAVATDAGLKRRHVHKFGGSSLADPVCYRRVASIVEQQVGGDELIVVSAAGKTTNRLIQLVELAEAGTKPPVKPSRPFRPISRA